MDKNIKYRKNKGYCYDNRHLFSELRKILLKSEKPPITKDMKTIELHKLVERINQVMAEKLITSQELDIPYIGRLTAYERKPYYDINTKKTNYPVKWNITRGLRVNEEIEQGKRIVEPNTLRIVRIRFSHKRHPHSCMFKFRTCQDVATRLIKYITDNNVPIYREKRYRDYLNQE